MSDTTIAVTPRDNPMGTDGFEFIEYAAADPVAMGKMFERLGFTAVARHRRKKVTLYRQGEINFILNGEPDSFAQRFARLITTAASVTAGTSDAALQTIVTNNWSKMAGVDIND